VLLDIPELEGVAKGKALDIQEMRAIDGFDVEVTGTSNYDDIAGADVVIVTAGVPRKPGMSRDDLVNVNLGIIKNVAEQLKTRCKDAFVIVITNPLDQMVYAMQKLTGFDPKRVCGMAGVLDSARLRFFLADAIGVAAANVNAMVLGGHGDSMVPLISTSNVNGVPVAELLSAEQLAAIVKRTAGAGGEIVALLKTGSAFFSPAASAIQMAEAYLGDKKELLPVAAKLSGEYGFDGIYFGVPAVIGRGGVEKIVVVPLTPSERNMLDASAGAVKDLLATMAL
jgi:malate dehydrogenase